MPIQVWINNGGGTGEIDVTRYVGQGSIQISKTLNLPSTMSLTLTGYDQQFVLPVPRSYIRVYSTKYRRTLFTGLLTVDPARAFQGLSRNVPGTSFQMYQYNLSYTSDEYLLNIKSVDFIPAFINQTQGQILRNLAETLAPGYYDTSMIASGDLVPYLQYDPTQTWSDYAKQFCDASNFRYSCQDRQIRFQPYGDGPLGISYDDGPGAKDGTFDPNGLSTSALTTQIINDVTVVGQQEAGNNHEDFFIGDGFTGAFPLKHQAFGLASSFQGSSVLLVDSWTQGQLNTSNWFAQDAANQFNYTGGALNIISGFALPYGLSYIRANNALELSGGIVLQHGEIEINDSCAGIIGGIYDDQTLNPDTCEAGFQLTATQTVVVTASGASGIAIQPFRFGAVPPTAFSVISKINKSYTLSTKVTAAVPVRYLQVFRSIAGYQYGGYTSTPQVSGSITWTVVETDAFTGQQTFYYFTLSGLELPDTAVYGLINNSELNISLTSTQIWTPPPGSLGIQCEIGSGLLGPIYVSGNVQYTGAFVTPSGGNLPILSGSYDPISARGFGPEQLFDMGSGIGNQAAELDSGTLITTLNFYSNDLPGVGTRIRLQTWESQAAVARVQNTASVALEAAVVGDDGVRASSISNLSPLPRTSEDCENACLAILADRTGIFYQGTYNCTYLYFKQNTGDLEFYPTCGRFLNINSPKRNMLNQSLLVTALTITVTEMMSEIIQYAISFGPDLYLEKLLAALTPTPSTNVLQPIDTAIQLTPQQLSRIGTYFLPDVAQSTLIGQISGNQVTLNLLDALPDGAVYEIRSADIGTWGQADSTLLYRIPSNQTLLMPRDQYDQTWYIKMISGAYIPIGATGIQVFNPNGISQSRRTKVLRVVYPQFPSAPHLMTFDTSFVQMDFAGDTRNVEGLEIRFQDDKTVCYQCIIGSRFDLGINMDQLRNQLSPGESGLTGLGQYLINPFPASGRTFFAHFFNLMFEYGPALEVTMPPFQAPGVALGYRWGSTVGLNVSIIAPQDLQRQDCAFTEAQFYNANSLVSGALIQDLTVQGNPGLVSTTVPVTGDLWIQVRFIDQVGPGAWSSLVFVPQGDLIASDYLSGQGSVPPAVLANFTGGGFLAYNTSFPGSGAVINIYSQAFSVWFPNGLTVPVPATSGSFSSALDVTGNLLPATDYGFFPSLKNPVTANPFLEFNGPYANYLSSQLALVALTGVFEDGSVPLTNGAFVALTAVTGSGAVIYIVVDDAGINYFRDTPYDLVITGDGSGAAAQSISNDSGQMISAAVSEGGSGYSFANAVVDPSESDGTGVTFTCTIGDAIIGGGGG